MVRRLQNRVAESRKLLPFTAVCAALVWIVAGVLGGELWIQFACFAVASYLMVELNTTNALIRIYSRLVSCSFIAFACMDCGSFGSVSGSVAGLCTVASLSALLRCYQDRAASGWVFCAFLALGVGSLASVWLLYYVPVAWILMIFFLSAMSWRTFMASIIGIVCPYWFASLLVIYTGDATEALAHFAELANYGLIADLGALSTDQILVATFVFALTVTGTIHFIRTSYKDKIRTRAFYYGFILVSFVTVAALVLQPQRYDLLIRVLVVNASPLAAHFFALTHTRVTNITFMVVVTAMAALTVLNLWIPL